MGFDNDCILNIQSLAGEYFCPVCHLLVYPNEALQAPCTHLYCKPCLTYVVSTTHACPYDGYRVTEADCKPLLESNKALADTIGKIQVHCLYYRTGCTWQGTLTDCSSHYSTCSFGDSPVLCNRCSAQIVHRQVQEHAQNCPGAQSQAQQTSTVQDTTSTGVGAVAEQNKTANQTGIPASQAQTSQTSQATDANQAANPAAQPQATQAAMPTPEQWQQYQQQYQQYYQQYPGYDPYQQNYQYYYQYQQGAQQYAQQPMQGYPPQPYGQAQPQVYAQAPVQPQLQAQQVQSHAQPQLQQQPQVPSQTAQPQPTASVAPQAQAQGVAQAQMQAQGVAQAQMQAQGVGQPQMQAQGQAPPQMQAQAQAQPHMQAQGQAPPQMQAQGQAQPHMQAQGQAPSSQVIPYNQSQPYAQPQPITQQMQVPQYQQIPQGQYPHSQPYPQLQTAQNYPYQNPQTQVQSQPHSQPTLQGPTYPPSQQNQPINSGAQFPTQNAVSGYQSYPQPQPQLQGPGGASQPMPVPGAQPQPQYPAQMQGKFSAQPSQMYAPQPYSNTPNQQLPAVSAHGQPPSGQTAQQQPVFPHSQQPGYPIQHRPGVQAAQQTTAPQQYGQQQSSVGNFPYMQPQPPMGAHPHAQGPPQVQQSQQNYAPAHGAHHNMAQSYAPRPVAQGAASQSYAPAAPHAGVGQVRPSQPNQTHPLRGNSQMSAGSEQQVGHLQQPARTGGEKPRDQVVEKSMHEQNNPNKLAKNVVGGSGAGVLMDEVKVKAESGLDNGFNGNDNELPGMGSKSGSDASHSVVEPSPGSQSAKNVPADHKDLRKKADSHDSKQTVKSGALNTPQPNLITQAHGTNTFPSVDQGRNQLHPMQFGPSAQLGPGAVSMSQSTPHSSNSQQSTIGHPPHLRQSGPGQAPPRPPFNSVDNSQPSSLQHPPGPIPHENASGAVLTPGTSGPFPRPSNMGYYQGNLPSYQAGQPQIVPGEPFGGSAFPAQRPGAFDSHVGARERADFEHRPSFPVENEKLFDSRKPELPPHGSLGRAAYGPVQPGVQPGGMRISGPPLDSISAPGMRDERGKPYSEEQLKHFPHRDFEDDPRKLPRPPHFEAGPSSKLGTQFPSSGPMDHGHHVFAGDGPPRPFDKAPHGFDRDPGLKNSAADSAPGRFLPPYHPNDGERGRPSGYFDDTMGRGDSGYRAGSYGPGSGPGFGRSHMDGKPPRSPGRDFSGLPPRAFGAFGDGGNSLPAEQFGKSIHDNRFPVPPNHLQRGEIDVPGSLRVGGPHNQDMLPNRLRRDPLGPRNMHMGEPPLAGNFQQHLPFGESFGGEKSGHPLIGEPGFRGSSGFQRFGREGGLYPEEMEPFDDPRRWKPVGIMCRICKVECGTVEGLDLHSQSREHQKKARDMVLSIKQQNKKQKISKGQAPFEGRDRGRPRNPSFQGRGNKY